MYKQASLRSRLGVRHLFKSSAFLTIFILALIVIFLLKEGSGFLGSYKQSLNEYRLSGLEYIDLIDSKHSDYIELQNELTQIRADWITRLQDANIGQNTIAETVDGVPAGTAFFAYRAAGAPLREYVQSLRVQVADAGDGVVAFASNEVMQTAYVGLASSMAGELVSLSTEIAKIKTGHRDLDVRLDRFTESNLQFQASLPAHFEDVAAWAPDGDISNLDALLAFLTGTKWITASSQHDWYGLLPLLTGSLLISVIALVIAIPMAVSAAIYVNQIAGRRERALIKPFIEFISALPSVVIGFFGVMVFGEVVRVMSRWDVLSWLPFFPVEERLNAFTAGALLALMAIPTIFTLSEDALENVSSSLKEASFAVGATRLQTTVWTILPSALSGIISAIMLGFGRVIGETMVVLLCAGNRIKIPDLDLSGEFLFDPVHTMTGLVAQEMGEVVYGSLHYSALFMVGIVLFLISLLVNYSAQSVAKRFAPRTY